MNRDKIFFGFFFFLFLLSASLAAQHVAESSSHNESDSKNNSAERSLLLSLEYGSDKPYYSRKLTTKLPYVAPSLNYAAPSGFFTGLIVYNLLQPDSLSGVDEIDWNIGWDFKLFKKINASASYTRYRYSSSSQQLRSILNNQIELFFSRDFKVITPKLYFDFLFGNNNNYLVITPELTHTFEMENLFTEDNDALLIKPSVVFYLGNFASVSASLKKEGQQITGMDIQTETKFGLNGIDFVLPLEYYIGRFIIEPAGYYNIPLNQSSITIKNGGTRAQKLQQKINGLINDSPVFYFTLTVGFYII